MISHIILYFRCYCKKTQKLQLVPILCFSVESQCKKEIVCYPCSNDNVYVNATNFCKTCADPEPFCINCARQHTRQKLFKEHQLCKEI